MGFYLPANRQGFAALTRLCDWSSGHSNPAGDEPPAVVAVLLFEPGVHLEIEEWMRWRIDIDDRESSHWLYFFVPATASTAGRKLGNELDDDEHRRRSTMRHWLANADTNQEEAELVIDGAWARLVANLFMVPPSSLPGAVVFCPPHGHVADFGVRRTFVPLRSPVDAARFFDALLTQARRLGGKETSEDALHDALPGWEIEGALLDEDWAVLAADIEGFGPRPSSPLTLRQLDLYSAKRLLDKHQGSIGLHGRDGVQGLRKLLAEWSRYVDEETRAILRSAELQYRLFESERVSHLDWAGVACGLAKAFERTVALSLVHEARRSHGVELPRYFDRYMPSPSGPEIREQDVNLNEAMSKRHAMEVADALPWKAPSIMDCQKVYVSCLDQGHVQGIGLDRQTEAGFRTIWGDLARLRNPPAHQLVVGRRHADEVISNLQRLVDLGVPQRLGGLRSRLAGGQAGAEAPLEEEWRLKRCVIEASGFPDATRLLPAGGRSPVAWQFAPAGSPELRVTLEVSNGWKLALPPVPFPVRAMDRHVLERTTYAVLALRDEPQFASWTRSASELTRHVADAAGKVCWPIGPPDVVASRLRKELWIRTTEAFGTVHGGLKAEVRRLVRAVDNGQLGSTTMLYEALRAIETARSAVGGSERAKERLKRLEEGLHAWVAVLDARAEASARMEARRASLTERFRDRLAGIR